MLMNTCRVFEMYLPRHANWIKSQRCREKCGTGGNEEYKVRDLGSGRQLCSGHKGKHVSSGKRAGVSLGVKQCLLSTEGVGDCK